MLFQTLDFLGQLLYDLIYVFFILVVLSLHVFNRDTTSLAINAVDLVFEVVIEVAHRKILDAMADFDGLGLASDKVFLLVIILEEPMQLIEIIKQV